jgi:hypothetical protein
VSRHALVVSSQIEGLLGADGDAIAGRRRARGPRLRGRPAPGRRARLAPACSTASPRWPRAAPATTRRSSTTPVTAAGSSTPIRAPAIRSHPDVPRVGLFIAPTDYRASTDDDFRGISAWELAARLLQR